MTIEANELRQLAETADGLRNQDLVLVRRGDVHMVIASADVLNTDTALIELRTDDAFTRAQRPSFEIELRITSGPSVLLGSDFDSLFWTLSAVDKFVVPYYARLWPANKVTAFRRKLGSDASWAAILHPPGSTPVVLLFSDGVLKILPVDEYLENEDEEEDVEEEYEEDEDEDDQQEQKAP